MDGNSIQDFIGLLNDPKNMTKQQATELSGRLAQIRQDVKTRHRAMTDEEKALEEALWNALEREQKNIDSGLQSKRADRENKASEHYQNIKSQKTDLASNRYQNRPDEYQKDPYDLAKEAEFEKGRITGKGSFIPLLDKCRRYADTMNDPTMTQFVGKLDSYIKNDANASGNVDSLNDEIKLINDLCVMSDNLVDKAQASQLDLHGDEYDTDPEKAEASDEYVSFTNGLRAALYRQKDGDLAAEFPYTPPVDPQTGKSTFRQFEPVRIESIRRLDMEKSINEATGKVILDREYDMTKEPLFPHDPSPDDVSQFGVKDCFLMSTLSGIAAKDPQKIRDMMCDNGDGTVTVRFFKKEISEDDGSLLGYRPLLVTVDKAVPGISASKDCLWTQMVERAYAAAGLGDTLGVAHDTAVWTPEANELYKKLGGYGSKAARQDFAEKNKIAQKYPFMLDADGDYNPHAKDPGYTNITGGNAVFAAERILGPNGESDTFSITDLMTNGLERKKLPRNEERCEALGEPTQQQCSAVKAKLEESLGSGSVVTAGSHLHPSDSDAPGIHSQHAYTVLDIGEKTVGNVTDTFVTVRNPHGVNGTRYVEQPDGSLKAEEWKTRDGTFDLRLSDFVKSFNTLNTAHIEKTATRERRTNVLKEQYLSDRSVSAYNDHLSSLADSITKTGAKGSDGLCKNIRLLKRLIPTTKGLTPSQAVKDPNIADSLRELRSYVEDNKGSTNRKTQKAVRAVKGVLDVMGSLEKGYTSPEGPLREKLALKLAEQKAASDISSTDPEVAERGRRLRDALNDPDSPDREKILHRLACSSRAVASMAALGNHADSLDYVNNTPDAELFDDFNRINDDPNVFRLPNAPVNAHNAPDNIVNANNAPDNIVNANNAPDNIVNVNNAPAHEAPEQMKPALHADDPNYATAYKEELRKAEEAILGTDRNILESKNSEQFRQLRSALRKFNEDLANPESDIYTSDPDFAKLSPEDKRRVIGSSESARALKQACDNYKQHCEATPKNKNKSRRIERLARTQSISDLVDGLQDGFYDQPNDYMRMELSEKAARGLASIYTKSDDPKDRERGAAQQQYLDLQVPPESKHKFPPTDGLVRREALVRSRFAEPGFKDYAKKAQFYELSKLGKMDNEDLMYFCYDKQLDWQKTHPTKEQKLAQVKNRTLYKTNDNKKQRRYEPISARGRERNHYSHAYEKPDRRVHIDAQGNTAQVQNNQQNDQPQNNQQNGPQETVMH